MVVRDTLVDSKSKYVTYKNNSLEYIHIAQHLIGTIEFLGKAQTESTEAMTDATIIITPVCHLKVGTPHWNGYGKRNHADVESASDTSVRQLNMVVMCR